MKRVELGHSGIEVTELGYGCMMFGAKLEREAAFEQLDAYLERGGNLLDTANIYGRRKIDGTGRAGMPGPGGPGQQGGICIPGDLLRHLSPPDPGGV